MSMLPIPTAKQIRGLSAADLAICLSYYATAKGFPCYYRDCLWLEWHDIEGLTFDEVANRWNNDLPATTRGWIVPKYHAEPLSPYVVPAAVNKLRIRLRLQPPRPDLRSMKAYRAGVSGRPLNIAELAKVLRVSSVAIRSRAGKGLITATKNTKTYPAEWEFDFLHARRELHLRPIGRGRKFWYQLLWWNWYSAEALPTYGNRFACIERLGRLPDNARSLMSAPFPSSPTDKLTKTRLAFLVCAGVRYCNQSLSPDQRLRYAPYPNDQGHDGQTHGSSKARRDLWLTEWESEAQRTYHNVREIIKAWDGRSNADRLAIGGLGAWRKLVVAGRSKTAATVTVYGHIQKAMWERQIDGKDATYSRDLWFFLQARRHALAHPDENRPWMAAKSPSHFHNTTSFRHSGMPAIAV